MADKVKFGESFAIVGLAIGATIVISATIVPAFILHGWAATKVWGWFVVPIFGLRQITIPEAIGLEMLLILLRPVAVDTQDKGYWKTMSKVYITPVIILGVAYLAHLFV